MGWGVTQSDPESQIIFNTVVDALVHIVLAEVCGPQESHHGLEWVSGGRNLVFYADNGRIVGRDPYQVQDSLSVTVDMFRRVGLETNLEEMKEVVCTPGFIWG